MNGAVVMKKVLLFLLLFLLSTTTVFAESTPTVTQKNYTVAIIPYLNTTEETKDFVSDVVQAKYAEEFTTKSFNIVAAVDVQKALHTAGYDVSNMELPEKDVFAAVAKETKADYVIAMEITNLISTRHMSFFSTKVETKAKLKYKFYNTSQDKLTAFQTTGDSENVATLVGNVGYKAPITAALNKAMNSGYDKIISNF